MSKRVLTPRECVEQAIAKLILDFRHWMVAETKALSRWKTQRIAYAVAQGRLVDDFQGMLDSYRKKEGTVPMLLIGVKQVTAPPDLSQVIGIPYELKTTIPTDPQKRRVTLRTEPRSYHVQFVFLAPDPDSANAFTSQFCSYVRLMEKRRFKVNYYLSPDLRVEWEMTIFDNSLYPDKADLEENNLCAGMVDFDISGLTPRVIAGLPPLYTDEFTETPDDGNGGGTGEVKPGWDVVIEADLNKDRDDFESEFTRVLADPVTEERTEQQIKK